MQLCKKPGPVKDQSANLLQAYPSSTLHAQIETFTMAVLSKSKPDIVNISENMLYNDTQSYTPVTLYDQNSDNEDFLALTENFIQYSSVNCNIVSL